MVRRLALTLLCAIALARHAAAGAPYINLPWYLTELVVAAKLPEDEMRTWRSEDLRTAELRLRALATPDTPWVERLPIETPVAEITCADFRVSDFGTWRRRLKTEIDTLPQWREAWHGVETRSKVRWGFLGSRGPVSIDLAAAVLDPGLPADAFAGDRSGGFTPEVFDRSALYTGAGFDTMSRVIRPLTMHLIRQEQCRGFVLYVWHFEKNGF